MAVATKYAGYFYCDSYDEILDITLFFTLMLFMLQRKANTGAEVILKVKVNSDFTCYFLQDDTNTMTIQAMIFQLLIVSKV